MALDGPRVLGSLSRTVNSHQEVQTWAVRLDASPAVIENCWRWLGPEERTRAERFHFDIHRTQFLVSHAVLRALLARATGRSPADLKFSHGANGKPLLADDASGLRFNMSHSGDLALYALTRGCEVGVDVEQIRPMLELENVAARFFAAEEVAELQSLPESDRVEAFFRCWTRKEAYVKAVGDGLSMPLDRFRVTLKPGEDARLVRLGDDPEAASRWSMHHLSPAPNFVGAVMYLGEVRPLTEFPLVTGGDILRPEFDQAD